MNRQLAKALLCLAFLALCSAAASARTRSAEPPLFLPDVTVSRMLPPPTLAALEADDSLALVAFEIEQLLRGRSLTASELPQLVADLERLHGRVDVLGDPLEYQYVIINNELVRICYQPVEILVDDGDKNPVVLRLVFTMPV